MRTPGEPSALATLEAWEVRKGRSWPSWGPLAAERGDGSGPASVDRQASTQCRILFDSGIFPRRERGGCFTPFLHALEVHEKSHTPLLSEGPNVAPSLSESVRCGSRPSSGSGLATLCVCSCRAGAPSSRRIPLQFLSHINGRIRESPGRPGNSP
ncbi:hypothetical protein J1605_006684 [Eschrichtius robustus]|uniref:Uncharacterized protein n=1 Tax=Eschrichtius robustus TaxID=9764 RepID=A0AB34H223_ESCRO|nr:hypothetical protein J1605_006684 [Eschrichtius robustus]